MPETPTTDEAAAPEPPAPTTVVQALARVMAELPGIGKTDQSEQGYSYRGIEAITRHAQELFGRFGVVFVPRVEHRETVHLTINNRPWTEEQLSVVYRVYGPGGNDDFIEVGPLLGFGRDNSDKGGNKAMTQAFKVALLQVLCIGDGKDDADKDPAHQADEKAGELTPEQVERRALIEAQNAVAARIRALPPETRQVVRDFCDERTIPRVAAQLTPEQVEQVEQFLDQLATDSAGPSGLAVGEAPAEGASNPGPAGGVGEDPDAGANPQPAREVEVWACVACGPHPDSREDWCGAGCGRDYQQMTKVTAVAGNAPDPATAAAPSMAELGERIGALAPVQREWLQAAVAKEGIREDRLARDPALRWRLGVLIDGAEDQPVPDDERDLVADAEAIAAKAKGKQAQPETLL